MSIRTELELALTKLSASAGLKPMEFGDSIVLEGKTVRIKLLANALKIEADKGELEVGEGEIHEVKFFKKTHHCLLKLKNGVLRICPDERDFRFFVKLRRD